MNGELRELVEEACPLVPVSHRARLVQQFNLAWDLAEAVRQSYPESRLPESINKAFSALTRIGEQLSRRTYCVGFLGPFQAGKSSTFNNVLNATDTDDEPAKVGQGFPTTAVITRLVKSASGQHRVRPVFLSTSEFQEKRQFLLHLVGFKGDEKDEVVLQQIPGILRNWNKEVRTRTDASGNEIPVRRKDVEYLALFLKSYERFRSRIADSRIVLDNVPFSERARYLQHPPDPWDQQDAHVTPLLHEVIIEYDTDAIPPTLELLDLPGYDGDCSVDAFLTDQFLKTLQAAFVFCRATDFGGIVETIVTNLRHVLGHDLRGRVWLVITRCDDINIRNDATREDRNIFEQIKTFAKNKGIPQNQIIFVTNDLRGFRRRLDDEAFRKRVNELIDAVSDDWPDLKQQWESLAQDGGIGALRRLIVDQVANQVGESIARQASSRLPELCEMLYSHLRELDNEKRLGELPDRITKWRHRLLNATMVTPSQFRSLADQFYKDLATAWDSLELRPELVDHIAREGGNNRLRDEFMMHAYRLDDAIHKFMRTKWTATAYAPVVEDFRQHEHADGYLPLPGVCDDGVAAYLEQCATRDQGDLSWINGKLPSFKANNPFDDLPEHSAPIYTGREYLEVMRRKMQVVSQQIAILLTLRVRQRVSDLLEQIRQYALDLFNRRDISLPNDWSQMMADFEKRISEIVRG
ncbi:MAG: hypothetical protein H5U08_08405 [Thermogutta sp.]|uniref:hypothetical protein n=1 Tax=Thermogutta sp. TaxID=1962930 RepID=UPI0019A560C1|nr:hypothetical protein [Thermogutta sp.]MBC7352365.1 hypothetical protein [Thermogutta sp.]